LDSRQPGASRRKRIMEIAGYVMLSALVLYMVQQIADLAA
jgi:hypothetical protein